MIVYQLELKSKLRLMCEGELYKCIADINEPPPRGVQSLNIYATIEKHQKSG